MTNIVPAIIPKNFSDLSEEIKKVKDFVSLIQIDVCDGEFAPSKTWPYIGDKGEFSKIINQEIGMPFWQDVDFEIHLMVNSPEDVVNDWVSSGASSVIFQIESTENYDEIIKVLRENQVAVGLSVKPKTSNDKISPLISKIDFLQIMGSNELGKHNVLIEEKAKEKIKFFRENYKDLQIAIDIGVNKENALELVSLGANKLISGSSVFEGNIKENIDFFNQI